MGCSELYVKVKVKKVDCSEFNTEEKETAVPIDLILHSMWSSVDIKMNHTLVSTSGIDYMYESLIETLLNYNDGAKRNKTEFNWIFRRIRRFCSCSPYFCSI